MGPCDAPRGRGAPTPVSERRIPLAKSLIITEKPSVARDITSVLGGFTEHEGYEENDEYVVTYAVGHLLELKAPEELDPAYKRWTLDNLPIIPEQFEFKAKPRQSERLRTIKKLIARDDVETLINACDAGREGEMIFRELVKYFGSDKPIRRLWLQSMTPEAIRDGFQRLRDGREFEGLAAAAECRSFADWLIGMNATRALTKRFKSRREGGAWSAGRVQTPTLALLVDREKVVLEHVPRPFWRIEAEFEHEGVPYRGAWFDPDFEVGSDDQAKDDRIFDSERAARIVAAVTGQPALAGETRKPSRETAPQLFDLTSLQREANSRLGWSARRTLSAAQRCYDGHKILTYPRTDSRCLPSDYRATVRQVLDSFAGASGRSGPVPLGEYARSARTLIERGLQNEGRAFNDAGVSDHFAIVPTGRLPGDGLSGDDRRLFDMVTRRFLATFHPPAQWERVERTTVAAEQRFRTRARVLIEPGWRAVLGADPENEESPLPPLVAGESETSGVTVTLRQAESIEEETKPPPRITEARLLSLMENAGKEVEDEEIAAALHERGIGTPATRAEIIENLIGKGYVVRQGKAMPPTVKAMRLIDALEPIHIDRLASPALTGDLEYHLREVERGGRTAEDFMTEMKDYAREIVDVAKTFEYDAMYASEPDLGTCPRTGRPVRESSWFYKADDVEDDKEKGVEPLILWKDTSGRYLDRTNAKALLEEGKTGVLDGFTARSGRTYRGYLELDRDEWKVKVRSVGYNEDSASDVPEYEVNPEPLGRCPFNEECQVVETSTQFVCQKVLKHEEEVAAKEDPEEAKKARKQKVDSCGFVFPRTVCKREVTRDEALVYLQNRRTDLLTDFTSRHGRPFSATLVLKDNGRHGFEFPPRGKKAAGEGDAASPARKAAAKSAGTGRKKTTRKKTTRKKTTTRKKSARKKKATGSGAGRKKSTGRKKTAPKASPKSSETQPGSDAG